MLTKELVERKVKKITRNTSKKRRESLPQMKKKGKQQYEIIWETGQNKMIENGMFSRYVKEGKKSLNYT